LMIPDQLRLVPIFVLFTNLGLLQAQLQYASVMLVLAISATSVFLMRQYFMSLPIELEEAARLDGAGFFTTFWRVLLPLATPALPAVAPAGSGGARHPAVPGHLDQLLLAADLPAQPGVLAPAAGAGAVPPVGRLHHQLAATHGHGRDGHHPDPGALHLLPALLR